MPNFIVIHRSVLWESLVKPLFDAVHTNHRDFFMEKIVFYEKKISFYIEITLHASQNAIDLLISIIFQDISSYNARHLNYNYKLFVVFRIGNIHFISSVEMCSLSNSSVYVVQRGWNIATSATCEINVYQDPFFDVHL